MRRVYIGILIVLFSSNLLSVCVGEDIVKQKRELHTQIVIYNLVNGLYLDEEQMKFILEKAEEIDILRQKLKSEAEFYASKQIDSLLALREEAKKEAPQVPRELAKEIQQNRLSIENLRKQYTDAVDEATKEIKAQLTDVQLYNMQNFQPCLVPPKEFLRIGQASSPARLLKVLEHIRAIPQARYENRKDEIANRFIEKLSSKHPYLKEEQLSEAKEKFLQIIEDVRSLSDVEFILQKQSIADEVKNIIDKKNPLRVDVDKKIAHFLLHPQIIPVLEEKLSERV